MKRAGYARVLAALVLAALIAVAAGYRQQAAVAFPQGAQFAAMARDMRQGAAYPAEPFYPPGLVWMYLGIFRLFGDSVLVERTAAVVLATLECLLVSLLAWRLAGPVAGVVSAALVALWPFGTAVALGGGGELTPVLLFLAAGLHLALSAERRGSLLLYAACGATLALPGLVRTDAFLVPAWLAAWLLAFGSRPLRLRIRNAATLVIVAFTLYVPWAARNYRTTGEVILTGVQARLAGYSLYAGIGEVSGRGGAAFFDDDRNYMMGLGSPVFLSEYRKVNAILMARSLQVMRSDPALFLRACLARIPVLFGRGGRTYHPAGEDRPIPLTGGGTAAWLGRRFQLALSPALLWLGAALSLALCRRQLRELGLVWAIVAYYVLVHIPLHIEGRYLMPVFPLLSVLFGAAAARAISAGR